MNDEGQGLVWDMVRRENLAKNRLENLKTGWTPKRDTWAEEMRQRVAKIFEVPPEILFDHVADPEE